MDKDSKELAIYAFGMLNENLSPLYLQARQDFLNRLAMSDVTLGSMRGSIEEGSHNREIISTFCASLPGAYLQEGAYSQYSVGTIQGPNIDEVVMQQASMLFVQVDNNSIAPMYVVGIDHKQNRLLLAPSRYTVAQETNRAGLKTPQAKVRDALQNSLIITKPDKYCSSRRASKFIDQVKNHIDILQRLYMPEAPSYSDAVFNRRIGLYEATTESVGSMWAPPLRDSYRYSKEHISYLPDAELATFEVMDHLSRLALTFNRGNDLLEALGKKTEKAAKNSIDTSFR